MALIFEWDKRKAKSNVSKHKVSFEEASTIFGDPLTIAIEDPLRSSIDEQRLSSFRGKILVVVHCERGDNMRIISARTATRKERKAYEKGK